MRTVARIFLSVVLLSVAGHTLAQQRATLNGLHIGQSKESAMQNIPKAECFVKWDGLKIVAEICDLAHKDLVDPILLGTDSKFSFHIQNDMVSAISVLIPASQSMNIVERMKTRFGSWIPVKSPIALKKGKQGVALLWDLEAFRFLVDFEPTESGELLLLAIPVQKK